MARPTGRLLQLTEEQGTGDQMLARLRLDALRSGDVIRGLSDSERQARQLIETARFAARNTALAEQDRRPKGKPYEDDSLFRYLWQRRYGTADCRADPFTRLLDGSVATLSGSRAAAANYRMLLEIPKRLSEHAEVLRTGVEAATGRVHALAEAALERGDSGLRRWGSCARPWPRWRAARTRWMLPNRKLYVRTRRRALWSAERTR